MKCIAAMNQEGIIGVDNKMPWYIPSELAHFKEYTMGATVLMGRNTFESIGARPLPGRNNVVISRCLEHDFACEIGNMEILRNHPDGIVIGGEQIYRQAFSLGLIDEICLSVVHREVEVSPEQKVSFFPVEYLEGFTEVRRFRNEEDDYEILWYRKGFV